MSNNKTLSKLEQIKLAAAAQSNKNIAQANVKESRLKVSDIKLNPFQPRQYFDEEKLNDLAESIKQNGLIQAITVAQIDDELILIAGERRLRAHQIAGLDYIDANLLYNITDEKLREMSLIENLQREDLSLIEEASAFKKLHEEYNKSYRDIATLSGKSKSTIADIINLSNFSEKCKLLIQENKLKNTSILNNILKCDSSEHYELILRLVDNDLTHKDIKNKLLDEKIEDNLEKPLETKIMQV
jgi:ParB family chromosome partitioning protein